MPSENKLAVPRPSTLIGVLALFLVSGCAHKQLATENKGRELKNEGPVIAETVSGQVRGALFEGIRTLRPPTPGRE